MSVRDDVLTVLDALAEGNQDQREIAIVGLAQAALAIRKNGDYGSSVFSSAYLAPEVEPEAGIRVRMSDKLSRFTNLISREDQATVNESLDDTAKDLSVYLMLWVILRMRSRGALQSDPVDLRSELPQAVPVHDLQYSLVKELEDRGMLSGQKPLNLLDNIRDVLNRITKQLEAADQYEGRMAGVLMPLLNLTLGADRRLVTDDADPGTSAFEIAFRILDGLNEGSKRRSSNHPVWQRFLEKSGLTIHKEYAPATTTPVFRKECAIRPDKGGTYYCGSCGAGEGHNHARECQYLKTGHHGMGSFSDPSICHYCGDDLLPNAVTCTNCGKDAGWTTHSI